MEDHYINLIKPEYNIAKKAGNTLGVKHTEDTKATLKLKYSEERRERIGAVNRGKIFSSVSIERIRTAALNRAPMSDVTHAKISENSANANHYTISMVDGSALPNGTFSVIKRTIASVAEFCGGCAERTVRRSVSTDKAIKGKWRVTRIPKV